MSQTTSKNTKNTKTNENPSPSSSMHKLVPFGSKLVPTWFRKVPMGSIVHRSVPANLKWFPTCSHAHAMFQDSPKTGSRKRLEFQGLTERPPLYSFCNFFFRPTPVALSRSSHNVLMNELDNAWVNIPHWGVESGARTMVHYRVQTKKKTNKNQNQKQTKQQKQKRHQTTIVQLLQ